MQNRSNEWQGSGAIIDGKSNKGRNDTTLEQHVTVFSGMRTTERYVMISMLLA